MSKAAAFAIARSNKRVLIRRKIGELAADPVALSGNISRLQGRAQSRLRVQDRRVIFRIEDGIVWIDEVGPRGRIYEE